MLATTRRAMSITAVRNATTPLFPLPTMVGLTYLAGGQAVGTAVPMRMNPIRTAVRLQIITPAIIRGTDPAGTWRTLSKDEWHYLLCERARTGKPTVLQTANTLTTAPLHTQQRQYVQCAGATDGIKFCTR